MKNGDGRITNIAHFFLSDLGTEKSESQANEEKKTVNNPWDRRISRIAPNGTKFTYPAEQQPTDQSLDKADSSNFLDERPEEDEILEEEEIPAVEECRLVRVIGSHLPSDTGRAAMLEFAKTLASMGNRVGVLELAERKIRFYGYAISGVSETETDKANFDGDFFCRLNECRKKLGHLLIYGDSEISRFESQLNGLAETVCVLTTPEKENLIRSYQVLKSLKGRCGTSGIFVSQVKSFGEAQAVYRKISATAREHLKIEIENFGYPILGNDVSDDSAVEMEISGETTELLGRLRQCLRGTKADESVSEEPATVILDNFEAKVTKSAGDVKEKIPASDANELLMIEAEGSGAAMAEIVGAKILFNSFVVKDSLYRFLSSAGFDCVRFEDGAGSGVVIVVLTQDKNAEGLDWVLEHFPKNGDRLIVVSDQPMGRMELSRWTRYFTNVEFRRMIRSQFNGRKVYVLERC